MIINIATEFLLNLAKEVLTIVVSTYILSKLGKKKKNHTTDKCNGSSSDE